MDANVLWHSVEERKTPTIIAGPCVIESYDLCAEVAEKLVGICSKLGLSLVFKASFDKANRTSSKSFRGPGLEHGLEVLSRIGSKFNLPILTDVHEPEQAKEIAEIVQILQIPAFLCRQTDLIEASAKTGCILNIKKGQFLSPQETLQILKKAKEFGNDRVCLTERGTTFGYNNLVVDMRSIPIMQSFGCPVIFDATHSVQKPGGNGTSSGGEREYAPILAKAAIAAGADGLFIETHPNPDKALSDGPNMIPLDELGNLLDTAYKLWKVVRGQIS